MNFLKVNLMSLRMANQYKHIMTASEPAFTEKTAPMRKYSNVSSLTIHLSHPVEARARQDPNLSSPTEMARYWGWVRSQSYSVFVGIDHPETDPLRVVE
jgi:hypothetical protein